MKFTNILPLLAFAIVPTLSQPRDAASHSTLKPTLAPRDVTLLCNEAGALIATQLDEITKLQSQNLPVPGDLAGYFYGIYYGRNLLGCPPTNMLGGSAPSKRSTAFDPHPEVKGEPCKVLAIQLEEVSDVINALKENNIPVPPFLAGRWSLVSDGEKGLQCGFTISKVASGGNSTDSSDGAE